MTVINLGQPTGPKLRQLSLTQEQSLDTWLTLALISPPEKREELPMGFTRALATLAKRRDIAFKFSSHEMRLKNEATFGKNIPGCVGGSKRRVVVTDERQLASKVGAKVEPYHEREWRDDFL